MLFGGTGVLARATRLVCFFLPELSESPRDRSSRIVVFQMQLHQRCRAQPQPGRISFRERSSQEPIKQKLRFEVRAGQSEFNLANAVAQVQTLAVLAWEAQQSLQSPAQIRCLADIRFAFSTQ